MARRIMHLAVTESAFGLFTGPKQNQKNLVTMSSCNLMNILQISSSFYKSFLFKSKVGFHSSVPRKTRERSF